MTQPITPPEDDKTKEWTSKTNGSIPHWVTQIEFERLRGDVKDDIKEIKSMIHEIGTKIDNLTSKDIPDIKTKAAIQTITSTNTKTKLIWTGAISLLTLIVNGIIVIVRGLLGV